MGKQYYLSDIEVKVLYQVLMTVDTLGANNEEEEEAEVLNKLGSKFHQWHQETK
ncbi:hypothetical protein LOZ80_38010 [Paenibacillus sp. HWE-109]|uniref:hypothetical protein n=1 Tax=Paenibacillus sp. HWE-109 TaxID=1306526 RepID=UPI001EDD1CBF|nr:hypothetical protein [Paenibacillus sp. HWE-109]UKS25048.1 hypothetical protein LOZ80_26075 [Paenibacillus sp. HWE-109]UKS27188.1 hypothetical protein LOZ80_38010 [Paenibacillus sp. HWE-109]